MKNNTKLKIDILDCIKDVNEVIVDTINWKEYQLGDLFEVKNNLQLNKDSFVFNNTNEYPYFTRTVNNNGIAGYVDYIGSKYLINGDCIGIGMMGMKFFYMEKDFYVGQFTKRIILKNKQLSKNIALFLTPLINIHTETFKSSSVKKFEKNFNKSLIKLPSVLNTETNEYEPDWKYMEDYISDLEKELNIEQIKTKIDNVKSIEKKEVNISEWKEYKLVELFEIKGSKTTPKKMLEQKGKGMHPYITTTASNQGVSGYYDFFTEKGNVLTFDSAVLGTCFYQEKDFSASDHVELGIPYYKNFNKKIGLYFQIVINKTNEGIYHYGHKSNQQRIKDTIIKLPSKLNTETKEYEPDWKYMEDYISELEKELNINQIQTKIDNIKSIEKEEVNISEWKEYKLVDLFEIEKGERLNKSDRKKGNTPFLTATSENNGVSNYIDENIIKMNKKINAITIDMFYNVFYHGYHFLGDDNVHILTLKKGILNKYIGIFIVECLKSNKDKYHYGLQLRLKHLIKETIKLPSKLNTETKEYEPDWKYMEDYISELETNIETLKEDKSK